jgi:hypothetical protein
MKNKVMITSGDESIFVKQTGKKRMIGSGEHAIFVSDDRPTMKDIDKKIAQIAYPGIISKVKMKILSLRNDKKGS